MNIHDRDKRLTAALREAMYTGQVTVAERQRRRRVVWNRAYKPFVLFLIVMICAEPALARGRFLMRRRAARSNVSNNAGRNNQAQARLVMANRGGNRQVACSSCGVNRNTSLASQPAQGIGVQLADATGGVRVKALRDGPAKDAGIEVGDLITQVNGKNVTSAAAVAQMTRQAKLGDSLKIKTDRNGELDLRTASLGKAPTAAIAKSNSSDQPPVPPESPEPTATVNNKSAPILPSDTTAKTTLSSPNRELMKPASETDTTPEPADKAETSREIPKGLFDDPSDGSGKQSNEPASPGPNK